MTKKGCFSTFYKTVKINRASIEEGYFNNRLNIVTGIGGVPDYIVSSGKEFLSLAFLIENKAKSNT